MNLLKKVNDSLVFFVEFANAFCTPRRILQFAVLIFFIHSVFSLFFNRQIYTDMANVYAWYARAFSREYWWDVPLSKVPILNIWFAGLVCRFGIETYSCFIVFSLLAMLLTLIPLYKLLHLFTTSSGAAWGCLFFMTAPKIMRFSGTGLLESTRDLFLVSACFLLLKNWRVPCKWWNWCLFGFFLGLLSIARGEGVFMAVCLTAGLLLRPVIDWKNRKNILQNIVIPVALSVFFAAAVASPVLVQNYKVTGYPVTDARMISVIRLLPGINRCFSEKTIIPGSESRILPHVRKSSGNNNFLERFQHLPGNAVRGAYEIYFILSVFGVAFLLFSKKWCREYTFLLLYCFVVTFFFVFFSVAYRYFIFIVPLTMVFTLTGIRGVLTVARKCHLQNILLVVTGVLILLQPFNAWTWMLDSSDAEERIAAAYLKENRQLFLSRQTDSGKLILHGNPRVIYWCDEARLFHYGEYIPEPQFVTGFDVLIINKKDQQQMNSCIARQDLQLIETPLKSIAVFVPGKKEK